jgi:hypothetical protein
LNQNKIILMRILTLCVIDNGGKIVQIIVIITLYNLLIIIIMQVLAIVKCKKNKPNRMLGYRKNSANAKQIGIECWKLISKIYKRIIYFRNASKTD